MQTANQTLLPFTGRSPRSRRASQHGAMVGALRAPSQSARMLSRYLRHGALSDLVMAKLLGGHLPESRISARRSRLMINGLVVRVDEVIGPFGATNSRWGLTLEGERVARQQMALEPHAQGAPQQREGQ